MKFVRNPSPTETIGLDAHLERWPSPFSRQSGAAMNGNGVPSRGRRALGTFVLKNEVDRRAMRIHVHVTLGS